VSYGVRRPDDLTYQGLKTAGIAEAARAAQAILLATPWDATEPALKAARDLAGKLLLDATNPLATGPQGMGWRWDTRAPAGEQVAAWAKGAAVFKTLNTTGFGNMENSGGYAQKPVMFFAGDDSGKRATVAALLADLGFGPGRCRAAAQCATLGALRDAVDRSRDEARPGPRHRLRADEARPAGLKKCACRHI
jgi:predicted dinucleotide-binding enzyme